MIKDIYNDTKHRMDQAVEHTRLELAKVRTGRANPELIENLFVSYYGMRTPLKQLCTISVPEPRLITIHPFDKTLIHDIEKSIVDSNLGLTPNSKGDIVMLPIPPLSEERRKDLIKVVHQLIEDGKVSIRNVRKDANHLLKSVKDEGHISEDEIERAEKEIQTMTDGHIKNMDMMMEHKEKELREF